MPKDRFPTMAELLAELGQDPAARRRRWLGATAGLALVAATAAGAHRFTAGQHAICAGGPDRAAKAWNPGRRASIQRAFAATGREGAAGTFARVSSLIDDYVSRWIGMYRETCEATHVRGEQSAEVLDLRMGCLTERLSGVSALGDVLTSADSAVLENAVSAASALPQLDRCADVEMLRAVIKPPDDSALRAKVADVRENIAKVKALGDSGQCEPATKLGAEVIAGADKTGYLPVKAEAHFAVGRLVETCTDATKATRELEEAAFAAESSRHDEIFIESTMNLASVYSDRLHDLTRAKENMRHSRAVLARFPGHPILEAWIDEGDALIALNEGEFQAALEHERRALALREQVFGPSHFEVASSLANIGLDLHALGRDAEAEPLIARAVDLVTNLFGADSARAAMQLVNHAEVLTSLGRFQPAHFALDRALSIWKKQSASSTLVGYGMLDLGRLELAEGDVRRAVTVLEQALDLVDKGDRATTAETQFALGRALWTARPAERRRALTLVSEAGRAVEDQPGAKRLLEQIRAWQSTHPAA